MMGSFSEFKAWAYTSFLDYPSLSRSVSRISYACTKLNFALATSFSVCFNIFFSSLALIISIYFTNGTFDA